MDDFESSNINCTAIYFPKAISRSWHDSQSNFSSDMLHTGLGWYRHKNITSILGTVSWDQSSRNCNENIPWKNLLFALTAIAAMFFLLVLAGHVHLFNFFTLIAKVFSASSQSSHQICRDASQRRHLNSRNMLHSV